MSFWPPLPAPGSGGVLSQDTLLNYDTPLSIVGGGGGGTVPADLSVSSLTTSATGFVSTISLNGVSSINGVEISAFTGALPANPSFSTLTLPSLGDDGAGNIVGTINCDVLGITTNTGNSNPTFEFETQTNISTIIGPGETARFSIIGPSTDGTDPGVLDIEANATGVGITAYSETATSYNIPISIAASALSVYCPASISTLQVSTINGAAFPATTAAFSTVTTSSLSARDASISSLSVSSLSVSSLTGFSPSLSVSSLGAGNITASTMVGSLLVSTNTGNVILQGAAGNIPSFGSVIWQDNGGAPVGAFSTVSFGMEGITPYVLPPGAPSNDGSTAYVCPTLLLNGPQGVVRAPIAVSGIVLGYTNEANNPSITMDAGSSNRLTLNAVSSLTMNSPAITLPAQLVGVSSINNVNWDLIVSTIIG